MAEETVIEVVAAPTGYDKTDYQFFRNNSTGNLWKASVDLREARSAMIANADVETAPTELAAVVTVSPIDETGKALRDERDRPIILDSHTHTFTAVEMAAPDFDPTDRILGIIAERVHAGEARLSGVSKLKDLAANWTKKAKLKAGKFTYSGAPNEGRVIPGAALIVGQSGPGQVRMPSSADAEAPPESASEK